MKRFLFLILLSIGFSCVSAQNKQGVPFNGLITDFMGNPAKRAKIYIDENYTTESDKKGRFGLTDVKDTDTLKVVYQKKKYFIPIEGRKSIVIKVGDQMDKSAKYEAEEDAQLVSVGYGYVKRRESLDVTNGIPGDVIRKTNADNVLDALKGLVPGLNITTVNGESKAYIRGIGTNSEFSDPLYIVDGIEVPNLNTIPVHNVENVEVIKDGSMYGTKGGNGVIIVRTIGSSSAKF